MPRPSIGPNGSNKEPDRAPPHLVSKRGSLMDAWFSAVFDGDENVLFNGTPEEIKTFLETELSIRKKLPKGWTVCLFSLLETTKAMEYLTQ